MVDTPEYECEGNEWVEIPEQTVIAKKLPLTELIRPLVEPPTEWNDLVRPADERTQIEGHAPVLEPEVGETGPVPIPRQGLHKLGYLNMGKHGYHEDQMLCCDKTPV
jgi:hypothetical protein